MTWKSSLFGDHDPRPPRPVDRAGIFATLELLVLQAFDRMIVWTHCRWDQRPQRRP